MEEEHLMMEWQWLAELLQIDGPMPQRLAALRQGVREANEQLCRRIRQGAFDQNTHFLALSGRLRQFVERKLEVANPRFLASLHSEGPANA
jgi:hypothetical protein